MQIGTDISEYYHILAIMSKDAWPRNHIIFCPIQIKLPVCIITGTDIFILGSFPMQKKLETIWTRG